MAKKINIPVLELEEGKSVAVSAQGYLNSLTTALVVELSGLEQGKKASGKRASKLITEALKNIKELKKVVTEKRNTLGGDENAE